MNQLSGNNLTYVYVAPGDWNLKREVVERGGLVGFRTPSRIPCPHLQSNTRFGEPTAHGLRHKHETQPRYFLYGGSLVLW